MHILPTEDPKALPGMDHHPSRHHLATPVMWRQNFFLERYQYRKKRRHLRMGNHCFFLLKKSSCSGIGLGELLSRSIHIFSTNIQISIILYVVLAKWEEWIDLGLLIILISAKCTEIQIHLYSQMDVCHTYHKVFHIYNLVLSIFITKLFPYLSPSCRHGYNLFVPLLITKFFFHTNNLVVSILITKLFLYSRRRQYSDCL